MFLRPYLLTPVSLDTLIIYKSIRESLGFTTCQVITDSARLARAIDSCEITAILSEGGGEEQGKMYESFSEIIVSFKHKYLVNYIY